MLLDLDTVIFVGFLAINLAVGLYYSRGIKTVQDYAIGDKTFSTQAIAATLVSTVIGAGFFSAALIESYRQGLRYIIPAFAEPIALIIMGLYLIPRMKIFLSDVSVAETMGKFYGRSVRLIVAVSGIIHCIGVVALQFKVAISIMGVFFDLPSFLLAVIAMLVVTIYSAFGGMKAVTFTDILQFFTFGVILPVICIIIWQENSVQNVYDTFVDNPLLDFKQVLGFNAPYFLSTISLFLFFIVPTFQPVFSPRVSMAKDITQAKRSHILAGAIIIIILSIICWTSILLLSNNPTLDPNNLLPYIINNYAYTGLKGLVAIGIMAIIMSTADSYINSGAVLFVHDIVSALNIKRSLNVLLWLRAFSVVIGLGALFLVLDSKTIFQLLVGAMEFYMPIVTVPIILLILGFRSSTKVVLMSMLAGLITVIFWSDLSTRATMLGINSDTSSEINAVAPAMLANLFTYIIAHFISGKPKLSGGESQDIALKEQSKHRGQYLKEFFVNMKNFSLLRFCSMALPQKESSYMFLGLFTIFSVFLSMHIVSTDLYKLHSYALNVTYYSALIIAFILIIYPLWSPKLKSKKIIKALWSIAVPYVLVFMPVQILIYDKYGQTSIFIAVASMIIFINLVRWQLAISILAIAGCVNIQSSNMLLKNTNYLLSNDAELLKFKIVCAILFMTGIFIAFLKPKQEAQELSEEMVDHLSHQLEDSNRQITELSTLKQTFLMNLQHETNTPITGVYSMSQALNDCYDKLTDEERKKAIATITSSSERLISYANNLIDTSKLMSSSCSLKIRSVDLSSLLEEVLRKCKKLYIPKEAEEDREFEVSIEPALKATCDDYYIRKSFENLIINSIQYCKKGKISISLATEGDKIKFIVKDSGIGIPNDELTKIFDPFVTSSKTLTPAGGRGVGLTLVKAAAEIHKGTITASSSEEGGSIFTLTFPAKHWDA